MMDEMRSDIISNFNSIVSDSVKREITAVLEPFERQMGSLGETVTSLERAANNHSDQLDELQVNVNKLTAQVESLSKKCKDLEGRSRWNNIRLVGLPEGSEGSRTTEFIAQLLQELLGLDSQPVLDRAHRSLLEKPSAGKPPRQSISRSAAFKFETKFCIVRGSHRLFFTMKRSSPSPPTSLMSEHQIWALFPSDLTDYFTRR